MSLDFALPFRVRRWLRIEWPLARLPKADLRPWLAFGLVLAAWQIAAAAHAVDSRFLPSPSAVFLRGIHALAADGYLVDITESLRRNLTGLGIGVGSGLLLGLLLGASPLFAKIAGPTVLAQRQTALFAWVPLLAMWFGGADAGKIAFISVAAFQPMVINTWAGIRNVPQGYRELSAALLFSRLDYARLVALPGASRSIFTGVQSALNYAWLATVGSEVFLNISPGLGARLVEGSQRFDVELLLVTIFFLGSIGLFYSSASVLAEKYIVKGLGP